MATRFNSHHDSHQGVLRAHNPKAIPSLGWGFAPFTPKSIGGANVWCESDRALTNDRRPR